MIVFVSQWFEYGYPIMNALGLFLLVLIISSLIILYKKTGEIYHFFTLGILSLVTGFVIFILKNFSLLPYNLAANAFKSFVARLHANISVK